MLLLLVGRTLLRRVRNHNDRRRADHLVERVVCRQHLVERLGERHPCERDGVRPVLEALVVGDGDAGGIAQVRLRSTTVTIPTTAARPTTDPRLQRPAPPRSRYQSHLCRTRTGCAALRRAGEPGVAPPTARPDPEQDTKARGSHATARRGSRQALPARQQRRPRNHTPPPRTSTGPGGPNRIVRDIPSRHGHARRHPQRHLPKHHDVRCWQRTAFLVPNTTRDDASFRKDYVDATGMSSRFDLDHRWRLAGAILSMKAPPKPVFDPRTTYRPAGKRSKWYVPRPSVTVDSANLATSCDRSTTTAPLNDCPAFERTRPDTSPDPERTSPAAPRPSLGGRCTAPTAAARRESRPRSMSAVRLMEPTRSVLRARGSPAARCCPPARRAGRGR